MTTHELARLLLAGPDLTVMVDGYDGGFDHLGPLQSVTVCKRSYHSMYCGEYEEYDPQDWVDPDEPERPRIDIIRLTNL